MIRLYKSINAVDPIYLILPGKTDFLYDLSDFPLRKGQFTVKANFKMVDCSDLFKSENPRWTAVLSEASLAFDPSAE